MSGGYGSAEATSVEATAADRKEDRPVLYSIRSSSSEGLADEDEGWLVCEAEGTDFQQELDQHLSQENEAPGEAKEWDISHGPRVTGLAKLGMVVPAVTRIAFNVLGGSVATAGYAAGKLGETIGAGKAIDSRVFRAGFTAWMWSNGIFPKVQYEPLKEAHHGLATEPKAEDMSLTPVIVSNHICYLDGMVLAAVFGAPKVVAMAGSKKVPVAGKLMEEMDVIFVERGDKNSRQATLDAIEGHCSSWQPGQRPLLIFPEGKTTNGEGVIDFKKGAFVAGKPVRPVLIVWTGQFDPATTTYVETQGRTRETSDAEWGMQMMGQFVHSLHVRVLAPYIPSEEEIGDAELYARNCQSYMADALKRVRAELTQKSWKESAGREDGGLGYRFGDLTKTAFRVVTQKYKDLRGSEGASA
eukprot:TRINITY_DN97995_c0_g1_i1.p1 TRINITY_DN97995_c0_g1~~TRINITY_DN97995_c0_g1_i1.p1  ORF type:complete len:413 (+),score=67.87 TRINITY_DN97995_c0_g1_i1:49-1287(+)